MENGIRKKLLCCTFISVLFIILLAALSGCAKKSEVTGEVLDGFGKPLPGANVNVQNTTFVATTNGNGRYAVGYVPGKVIVTIAKEGCTSAELALDIATESRYPAKSVTLYKLPLEKGIVAFGASDYVPLPKGKLSFRSKKFPFSWDKPLFQEFYTVTGEFVAISGGGAEVAFLDNDGQSQQLFAVTATLADPDALDRAEGVILSRIKKWMDTKDDAMILKDKAVKIAPDVYLRKVTLAAGRRYAFVTQGAAAQMGLGGIGSGGPAFGALGHPIGEPVYIFEVK